MIRISRDELKSSANDHLISVASQVSQEIDDYYRYTWLAPLRLVKRAIESETLGVNEKLSLLTEAIKNVNDVVALQISVQGVNSPLLVTQNEFTKQLTGTSVDPSQVLMLSTGRIAALKKDHEIFVGDLQYLSQVETWLVTIILPLADTTFGRPSSLSARINLERLKKRIDNHPFSQSVTISLLDPSGYPLFEPNRIGPKSNPLMETAQRMLASDTRTIGVLPFKRASGEKMLGAYAFPQVLDLGVTVEKNEAEAYLMVSQMEYNLMVWIIIGFSIAVVGAVVLSISLTRPLLKLTRAARKISKGDLTVQIKSKGRADEISELSHTFDKMVSDLRAYIDKLTETTKAKERAESELELAKKIQQSFLPKAFPRLAGIDVWGTCDPAREVGGDYFDFFRINADNYGMVIGDVSGKGVAAALFMAVSRTLFRILSASHKSPAQVLTEFNDRLVQLDQGTNMFITVFYGVIHLPSGRFQYSSAGHHMPFVMNGAEKDHKFQLLPQMKTMVAGMMENIPVQQAETPLSSGDTIVLYTDGLTEAVNPSEEMFGETRLENLLSQHVSLPAEAMCRKVVEHVHSFHAGRDQSDDMTLFILKIR